ncbi:hypothetical protein ACHAPT_000862 [Fusarium lateritium]
MKGFFRAFLYCCFSINLNKAKKQAAATRPVTFHETKVNPVANVPGNVRRRSSISSLRGQSRPAKVNPVSSAPVRQRSARRKQFHPTKVNEAYYSGSSHTNNEPVEYGPEPRRPIYQPTRPGLQPKKPAIKLAQQPLKLASQNLVRFASTQANTRDCNTALYNDKFPPSPKQPAKDDRSMRTDKPSLPPYHTDRRFGERKRAGESPWAQGQAARMTPIRERRTDSRSGSSNDVFYPTREW